MMEKKAKAHIRLCEFFGSKKWGNQKRWKVGRKSLGIFSRKHVSSAKLSRIVTVLLCKQS